MMSDDDDVCIVGEVAKPIEKVSHTNEVFSMKNIANLCFGPVTHVENFIVEIQTFDTCLVHAIINALQKPKQLRVMLETVKYVCKRDNVKRKDVSTGVYATKILFDLDLKTGFDIDEDEYGILYTKNHFLAMRRAHGTVFVLDSLNGNVAPITDHIALFQRCTPYHLAQPRVLKRHL